MEINVNDLINELNEISKKVKVLSINDDGEANVEFASKNSLKEFLIEVQSQEGGPSINEDEVDDYINEILN
jgi:hypothetical protein